MNFGIKKSSAADTGNVNVSVEILLVEICFSKLTHVQKGK
jgi:hypothetical protein